MATSTLDDLRCRFMAGERLLFLKTWEEHRWQQKLTDLAEQLGKEIILWSSASGPSRLPDQSAESGLTNVKLFLSHLPHFGDNKLFVLKDLPPFLEDPLVVRQLREQVTHLSNAGSHLVALCPEVELPIELIKDASVIDLPLPGFDELQLSLERAIAAENEAGHEIQFTLEEEERMLKAVMGLTVNESDRAFRRAIQDRDAFDEDVITILVNEKKNLLQGSNLLEFQELSESVGDVGGLDGLKEWVESRAKAFGQEAAARGIEQPKGVLLLGVQGCGKSLSARVIARQLSFPLVRLDFANLLESGRGSSEQNLREVLRVMDTIAPAVLWIEELDKGFAGLTQGGDDSAMSRMVGRFLTWMQEHRDPVFVVATANNVTNLPPELLRRGRFDELFFIDLPNYHERKHILSIHLLKRGCSLDDFDMDELSEQSDGYSGAELEQVVNSAVIEAYTTDKPVTQKLLLETKEQTVPLSVTMEDPIFQLREWAKGRCRPATQDSRVLQMLEEEQRKGVSEIYAGESQKKKWEQLAQADKTGEALIELTRFQGSALFPSLQKSLAPYLQTTGDHAIVLDSDPNVAMWTGLGEEFAKLIAKYVQTRRLYVNPVDVKDYQKAKFVLKLPVLRELREKPLPKLVWFPCVLKLVPPSEGSGRLGKLKVIEVSG